MNFKTNLNKLLISAFLVAVLTSSVWSAPFTCSANISSVLIYANGSVNVNHTGRGAYTVVCSLKEERQGVSIPTCALWTATLQNAMKDNLKLRFYYSGTDDYTSCAELPHYGSAPAPVYIGEVASDN